MSITAKNITFHRHTKRVLHNITLAAKAGEVLALLGPNGAGKSTLLQLLSGELTPDVGEIYINNRQRSAWKPLEIAQILAVLPQLTALNFPLTAQEVVTLGRIPHATSPKDNEAIVDQCLQDVDMLTAKDRQYGWLSGGERQRVQMARVLAQIVQPDIQVDRYLLLDEPTSALDLSHQHLLLKLLRRLASQRVAILITVHDLNLAMQYADRVILLKEGEIVGEGSPATVLTAENIAQTFNLSVTLLPHPTLPDRSVIISTEK